MSLIKPILWLLALVNSVCVVLIQNPFFSLLFWTFISFVFGEII